MTGPPLQLRTLRPDDETSFRAAVRASAATDSDFLFAFDFGDDTDFSDYVVRLERRIRGLDLEPGWVPATYLVGVVDDAIVGRVSIRHELNDFLSRIGGHIGYGVIPSRRGRGHATAMLRLALPYAASLGLRRVLLTCDEDNLASARVIEKNGGVFEGLARDPSLRIPKRRYWIEIG